MRLRERLDHATAALAEPAPGLLRQDDGSDGAHS